MEDIIISRPMINDEWLEELSKQDVATVHEAMGQIGALTHEFRPIRNGMKMCGRALTVKCHSGDNIMLIKAISMARPGDVVIADMGRITDNGPFGEVLAVDAVMHGVRGLVVNCGVRDSAAIAKMGFPVFSTGISVFGTSKASKGTINHPIVIGNVLVNPGDIVLGDDDGVVIIPFVMAEKALAAANARTAKEVKVMERLRKGESLFTIYGYQTQFDALGITEEVTEQ